MVLSNKERTPEGVKVGIMIYELHGITNTIWESDKLIAAGPDIGRLKQIQKSFERLGYKRFYIKARKRRQA